jgi:hypothetical protein
MSDLFYMLQNAPVYDQEGEIVGQTVGFEILNGRMKIRIVAFDDSEDEPDDGAKEDIPEPIMTKIRAISGDTN